MAPVHISLTVGEYPALGTVVAALARIPYVSAFRAYQLPPSPLSDLPDELGLASALEDAKAEIRLLRQRLTDADEALDARGLELRGARAALQGLREVHIRLIFKSRTDNLDMGED